MKKFQPLLWLAVVALCGCEAMGITPRPEVSSISDGIAVTSADITAVATEIQALCGNTEPGGECSEFALIETDTKDQWKIELQTVQDGLIAASAAVAAGDAAGAQQKLALAEVLLQSLRNELMRRAEDE